LNRKSERILGAPELRNPSSLLRGVFNIQNICDNHTLVLNPRGLVYFKKFEFQPEGKACEKNNRRHIGNIPRIVF
jgi:hypothetical protein